MISLFLLVAVQGSQPAPVEAPVETPVEAPVEAPVEVETSPLLTTLLVAELGELGYEVLASSELKRGIVFEGNKQASGCEDDTDCLAELADGLGARFVVFGQLASVGEVTVLSLQVFDSEEARSVARLNRQAAAEESFVGQMPSVARELREALGEVEVPVLVLDVKKGEGVRARAPRDGTTWFVTGGVVAGVAVLTAATGIGFGYASVLDEQAALATDQISALALLNSRDEKAAVANATFIAAAGIAVVGGGVAAIGLLVGDE